jgi:GNAT superfamily N-acetyltransferase
MSQNLPITVRLARPEDAEADGKILGWVHAHLYNLLVDDPEIEIGGLVVDETVRGQRIGEQLMRAAEAWTLEKGCSSVYLRSNVIRTRAHEFYKRLGYSILKSQYAFRKVLK